MEKKLEEALNNVEMTYQELVEIANDMLKPIIEPANMLVSEITSKVNCLTIEQIRDYILQLQLKAFELSEIKEKSAMKAELAEALQKEAFAVQFNSVDGAAAVKDKLATVGTSAETVSKALYNLTANLLKTKLDQCHRMVAALSSILVSRMQEAKFMNFGSASDIPVTTDGKTKL